MTLLFEQKNIGEIVRVIGEKAKSRRKRLNFSRKALAQKSGVSISTITRFENDGVITLKAMLKLARALESLVDFEDLFNQTKYKSMKELFEQEGK